VNYLIVLWIKFLVGAGIIVLAGTKLTKCADILSERLNIGKVWVGVLLLGIVTSLPEAIASLTAVISFNSADLAIGNLVGSCNWNILLIAILDLLYRKEAITNRINPKKSHYVSMGFAAAMVLVVGLELMSKPSLRMIVVNGNTINLSSILIIALYFIGMRKLSQLSSKEFVKGSEVKAKGSLAKVYFTLFVNAAFVVIGAIWLTSICDEIAAVTTMGSTFVGSLFLALATSLPEMVVTISALRINALDLAFGNIFGSNITNLAFVGVCDFFKKPIGTIYGSSSVVHIVTIFACVLLTGITLIGIKTKKRKIPLINIGWDSLLMIALFVTSIAVLYWVRPTMI